MSQIIFVHGAGLDSRSWANQAGFFADSLAIDLPGHGESTEPAMDAVSDYATWLGDEMRHFSAGPVTLIGHSLGSLIVLEAAANNPDFVGHLVLIATSASMPVHHDLMATAEANDPAAAAMVMKWSLTDPAYGRTKGWVREIEEAFIAAAESGVLANDFTACNSYDRSTATAARVHCPTLLVLGERDKMTKPRSAQPLAAALADARIVIIEGGGHMLPLENAAAVNDTISLFLSTP
jgi:pimeloyl-ACP methyl ester carboxylesterase